MPEFANKYRMDPDALSTRLMKKAARDMVTRIRRKTEEQLGDHCCEDHRQQTLQTSIVVTGFMMMAGEVLAQTGPFQMAVLDQAFRIIVKELTGEDVPQADGEAGDGHAH